MTVSGLRLIIPALEATPAIDTIFICTTRGAVSFPYPYQSVARSPHRCGVALQKRYVVFVSSYFVRIGGNSNSSALGNPITDPQYGASD